MQREIKIKRKKKSGQGNKKWVINPTGLELSKPQTEVLELGLNFAPAVAAPSKTALKELAKNDEIEILPAEKGNATVVMNTADYEEKLIR